MWWDIHHIGDVGFGGAVFWKVSIITVLPFEVSVIPLVVWREVLQDKVELILNLFLYFLVY